MNKAISTDVPAALGRVQRKIEQWRQTHRPRTPWPDELWRQASDLARAYGINPIAQALRLDYYTLKRHVEGTATEAPKASPQFMEILAGGTAGTSASRPQCLIEVEQAGRKMRICLEGGELPDVLEMLPELLREGRR